MNLHAGDDDVIVLNAAAAGITVHPSFGGRLGQISVAGQRLLRGPEAGAALGWGYWGCYPLLPWSNRIPAGLIRFEGQVWNVPVNWIDGTALHGLVAASPWVVESVTSEQVGLSIEVDVGPYNVTGRQTYRLFDDRLEMVVQVTNRASHRVPVGVGIHPWFRAGTIRVPADSVWPGDSPMPTGMPVRVRLDGDLRSLRVPAPMDRCFTDLTEAAADVPGIRLTWSGPVTNVVVFSEDPDWVCVEPVTMANDGFRMADEGVSNSGVIVLDRGESTGVAYTFAWM